MQDEIRELLLKMAEPKYREFSKKLLPGVDRVLGVRLPALRKLAQALVKRDWEDYLQVRAEYFEETMLQGMIIGYAQVGSARKLELIREFLPRIDNWSVCDSFCSGLKFTKGCRLEVWRFLTPYFSDEAEYKVRFALVMSLQYYVDEKYLETVFAALRQVRHEGYYAKMAAAWAVSICFVKFPAQTMRFLNEGGLEAFIYQKSLQKITESYKVDAKTKAIIRRMKAEGRPRARLGAL